MDWSMAPWSGPRVLSPALQTTTTTEESLRAKDQREKKNRSGRKRKYKAEGFVSKVLSWETDSECFHLTYG